MECHENIEDKRALAEVTQDWGGNGVSWSLTEQLSKDRITDKFANTNVRKRRLGRRFGSPPRWTTFRGNARQESNRLEVNTCGCLAGWTTPQNAAAGKRARARKLHKAATTRHWPTKLIPNWGTCEKGHTNYKARFFLRKPITVYVLHYSWLICIYSEFRNKYIYNGINMTDWIHL